jgi:hypothetical protein
MDGASTWKKSELVSVLWRFLGLFLPSMLAWDLQTRKLSLRQYLFGCNLSYHFPFTTQLYTSLLRNPYYCTSSLHSNALQWHTSLHWKTLHCTLALQTNALPLHTSLCKKTLWLHFIIVHTNALPLHTLYTITIGTSKILTCCYTRIGNNNVQQWPNRCVILQELQHC